MYSAETSASGRHSTWMIVVATMAQNVATGVLFGSFGTMLFALEHRFGADRGESSLTLSLAVVSLSLTAFWMGSRLGRLSLRPLMMAGSVISAAGFALLSVATEKWQLWAIYLLLLGPGAGLCGVLASNTLATQWSSDARRGMALGWVNAPLMVTIMPLAAAAIMKSFGMHALFLTMAAIHLAMLPVLSTIRENRTGAPTPAKASLNRAAIASIPLLVLLILVEGIVTGGGLMKQSHLIPLVTAQGYNFDQANLLLAITGATGVVGSLVLGWLVDRIGAANALALNALVQALVWTILLIPVPYGLLVVDAVIVGMCGGGLQTIKSTLVGLLFGRENFARVFGLLSLFTLPFLFGVPWLAGVLYVHSGSYWLPVLLQVGGFLLATVGALALARREKQARAAIGQLGNEQEGLSA